MTKPISERLYAAGLPSTLTERINAAESWFRPYSNQSDAFAGDPLPIAASLTSAVRSHMDAIAADERKGLRSLFDSCVHIAEASKSRLENAIKVSPMFEHSNPSGGMKCRATIAGLRDVLPMPTLRAFMIEMVDMVMATDYSNPIGDEAESIKARLSSYIYETLIPALVEPGDVGRRVGHATSPYIVGLNDRKNTLTVDITREAALIREAFAEERSKTTPATTTPATTGATTSMTTPSTAVAATIPTLDEPRAAMINMVLSQVGIADINSLIASMNSSSSKIVEAETAAKAAREMLEAEKLRASAVTVPASTSGTIPSGKVVLKTASDVFNIKSGKEVFDFKLPVWQWDGVHPHVPTIDKNYIFRPFELMRVLYALVTNQRCYLHGHTGTGKTTLIEQVAAMLNWPFVRINFDSEITRMDLIGREVLKNDGGVTTSEFVDGILPQVMSGPYITCFDEIDFVRPDVGYVMQRALEGNGLMLTEDGGRMVVPHAMYRMFATGNTVGQGDEYGLYPGARPQSMAFLDRFTVWVKVDYLNENQRSELIKRSVPTLPADTLEAINKYITEHLVAFTESNVMQPLSPRGYLSLAASCAHFFDMFPCTASGKKLAMTQAFETTILDRASSQDRAVLSGIVNRCVK